MRYSFITTFLLLLLLHANSQVKDTIRLACPLQKGIMKSATQDGYGYKADMKMIIASVTDTLVLSPVDGKVDLITAGADGKYEIVMHHKDYNIWLIGVSNLMVRKNDQIKKEQPVGKVKPGDEIEFLFFNGEEPINPEKLLSCKH